MLFRPKIDLNTFKKFLLNFNSLKKLKRIIGDYIPFNQIEPFILNKSLTTLYLRNNDGTILKHAINYFPNLINLELFFIITNNPIRLSDISILCSKLER